LIHICENAQAIVSFQIHIPCPTRSLHIRRSYLHSNASRPKPCLTVLHLSTLSQRPFLSRWVSDATTRSTAKATTSARHTQRNTRRSPHLSPSQLSDQSSRVVHTRWMPRVFKSATRRSTAAPHRRLCFRGTTVRLC